jgi:hypothetical protein
MEKLKRLGMEIERRPDIEFVPDEVFHWGTPTEFDRQELTTVFEANSQRSSVAQAKPPAALARGVAWIHEYY